MCGSTLQECKDRGAGAGVTGSSKLPDVGARVFLAIRVPFCPYPLTPPEQSMWVVLC